MRRALTNESETPKQRGRHTALPDGAEVHIFAWITGQAEKGQPVTGTDTLHYCVESFS
jgi:hypothetical protein